MAKVVMAIPKEMEHTFTCKRCGYLSTVATSNKNTVRWVKENNVCWHCRNYKKLPFVPLEASKPIEVKEKENSFSFFEDTQKDFSGFFS
jgi:hypothetical protein